MRLKVVRPHSLLKCTRSIFGLLIPWAKLAALIRHSIFSIGHWGQTKDFHMFGLYTFIVHRLCNGKLLHDPLTLQITNTRVKRW